MSQLPNGISIGSAACAAQAHSPAAAGEQCRMHSWSDTLQCPCPLKSGP